MATLLPIADDTDSTWTDAFGSNVNLYTKMDQIWDGTATDTPLATINQTYSINTRYFMTEQSGFVNAVNTSGTTYLILCPTLYMEGGTWPNTDSHYNIYMVDQTGTTDDPYLDLGTDGIFYPSRDFWINLETNCGADALAQGAFRIDFGRIEEETVAVYENGNADTICDMTIYYCEVDTSSLTAAPPEATFSFVVNTTPANNAISLGMYEMPNWDSGNTWKFFTQDIAPAGRAETEWGVHARSVLNPTLAAEVIVQLDAPSPGVTTPNLDTDAVGFVPWCRCYLGGYTAVVSNENMTSHVNTSGFTWISICSDYTINDTPPTDVWASGDDFELDNPDDAGTTTDTYLDCDGTIFYATGESGYTAFWEADTNGWDSTRSEVVNQQFANSTADPISMGVRLEVDNDYWVILGQFQFDTSSLSSAPTDATMHIYWAASTAWRDAHNRNTTRGFVCYANPSTSSTMQTSVHHSTLSQDPFYIEVTLGSGREVNSGEGSNVLLDYRVRLYQGTGGGRTTIATWNIPADPRKNKVGGNVHFPCYLTSTEQGNITDYSDLYVGIAAVDNA